MHVTIGEYDMDIWLIPLIIIFGLSRGIDEGMTMIMSGDIMHTGILDGIRGHAWFDWYHTISAIPYLALFVIVWIMIRNKWRWLYYLGLAVLLWECTEIGELVARYGWHWPLHEHVNWFDVVRFNVDGAWFVVMHVVRVIVSAVMIWIELSPDIDK